MMLNAGQSGRPAAEAAIRLLEADPELGEPLAAARRAEAERVLVVRSQRLDVGPWQPAARPRRPRVTSGCSCSKASSCAS